MNRRFFALPALALAAASFTGCVGIRSDSAEQVDLISDQVEITTFLCPEDNMSSGAPLRATAEDNETPCFEGDRDQFSSDADQLLLAYRVPEDTSGPDTLEGSVRLSPNPRAELRRETVRFRRSSAYERGLEQRDDDGEPYEAYGKRNTKWIGYVSDVMPEDAVGELRVVAPLTVSERGAFEHQTVVGFRAVDSAGAPARARHDRLLAEHGISREAAERALRGISLDPDREVDCAESRGFNIPGFPMRYATTECLVDPDVPESSTLYLRELLVAGGEGFGEAGSTVTVPFTLTTTARPVEGHEVALTAVTGLEGATATPQWPTTDLPLGDAPRPVDVQIPAGAAPGAYPVTLTARTGDETREAAGTVVVVPPAPATVAGSAEEPREPLTMNDDGTVSLDWDCGSLCGSLRANVLTMKAGIAPTATTAQAGGPRLLKIGTATFTGVPGQSTPLKIRLFSKAQRAVNNGRTIKAIIVVRRNGTVAPIVRRVTISKGS